MLFSEFKKRLHENLAKHDLTVWDVMCMGSFDSLGEETQHSVLGSMHDALLPDQGADQKKTVLIRWLCVLLGRNRQQTGWTPTHMLYELVNAVAQEGERLAAASVASARSAGLECARSAGASIAAAKDEVKVAKASVNDAVAKAVKEALDTHGLCAVCHDAKADHMPFRCNHIVMCGCE